MEQLFQGSISVKSILESSHRNIIRLYVDTNKRTKDFSYIIHLAKKKKIPISFLTREQLDTLAQNTSHGGILLEASHRTLPLLNKKVKGLIMYINGVEDPYNLGSICRSLYAAGCQLLILPKRDWSYSEATILKASAGAYEKLHIVMIDKDQDLVDYVKKNHIPLYSAYRKDARSIYDTNFDTTCCIAIGGAMRGLSSTILKATDYNVFIEYGTDFRNALDSPSAASIFAFEYLRQKRGTQ